MTAGIFSHHAPLIRDYPSAPPPPPAPPDPPEPPQPPQAEPIAFSAVAKASLFGVIGTAISSTTLATITCADAAMTIVLSEAVAGLTFSYSAGILSVAGTPTGSTRRQRVVVSYIASDGSNSVRGSTSHEITLVNASEVLTIGSQSGAAGRVGRPLSATLASPSANYNVNVTAHPASLIPGCTASLEWTPGATSSGTLTLEGTPTRAGTLPLVVNYRSGASELGTSTHSVVIAEAYEPPPADPDPTPSPTPVVPADPGPVTPTPMPGRGPDPTLANLLVLMRFNAADRTETATAGPVKTHYFYAPEASSFALPETLIGNDFITIISVTDNGSFDGGSTTYNASQVTVIGKTVYVPAPLGFNSHSCAYKVSRQTVSSWSDETGNVFSGGNVTVVGGAVGEAGGFTDAATALNCTIPALDGSTAGLSVECMADIGATAWASLTAAGADQRFCPVVSYTGTDGALLWALGFLSRMVDVGIPGTRPWRRVDAMFWTALDDAYSPTGSGSAGGGGITARPARFVHLAGVLKTYTATSWERASWLAGGFCISRLQGLQSAPVARSTGVLKIGGACPAFNTYDNPAPLTTIVPFTGVVDELRIKAPGQYADLMNTGVADAITPARRVIPWPNY